VIFKTGDKVLCVQENDIPSFVGTVWSVVRCEDRLVFCLNKELYINVAFPDKENLFPFKKNEVVLITPLVEELL
jgi:hypothetical protein